MKCVKVTGKPPESKYLLVLLRAHSRVPRDARAHLKLITRRREDVKERGREQQREANNAPVNSNSTLRTRRRSGPQERDFSLMGTGQPTTSTEHISGGVEEFLVTFGG